MGLLVSIGNQSDLDELVLVGVEFMVRIQLLELMPPA